LNPRHRPARLLEIVYAADCAEAATDPDECAVLDADVRTAWESVRREWVKEQGRSEGRSQEREPRRRGRSCGQPALGVFARAGNCSKLLKINSRNLPPLGAAQLHRLVTLKIQQASDWTTLVF
jgi:hypothetical protein